MSATSPVSAESAARLVELNENLGYFRSRSEHSLALAQVDEALALVAQLDPQRTEPTLNTLINVGTAQRAAGQLNEASTTYAEALSLGEKILEPDDPRLAPLLNNYALLLSDSGEYQRAQDMLEAALEQLHASPDSGHEWSVQRASTESNLASVLLAAATAASPPTTAEAGPEDDSTRQERNQNLQRAAQWANRALFHYRDGLEGDGHQGAARLVAGQILAAQNNFPDARILLEKAETQLAHTYGPQSDGARRAQETLRDLPEVPAAKTYETGLELSRAYWETHGVALLEERYPHLVGRIAAGLVGPGSECFGFDDANSHDHDFGPRFCWWLEDDDFARYGKELQADYEALPAVFGGLERSVTTARARGRHRRDGVMRISDFYQSILRQPEVPDDLLGWLAFDEATLATATNGAVFSDPLGRFSAVRNGLRRLPSDLRLHWLSQRVAMMAQAGQYNLGRMWDRGDMAAVHLSLSEFFTATASAVFLLERPQKVGYLPYYKWVPAALCRACDRPGALLPDVHAKLLELQRAVSAGQRNSAETLVEEICAEVATAMNRAGLSRSPETFLEWHRPHIEERITTSWLRSSEGAAQ